MGTYRSRRAGAAPSPAVAGFRPAGIALAVAAAFMGASSAFGQPAGATAIQGQAFLQQQGNSLVVKTLNAAGTNRSVINWQSFSVPAGSTTRFDQPTAQSLSINRVTGNDPSAIFGTLSSNGRLVLVNPAGIAVGAGAVVDTAGFTASTLRMSEADALAGRLIFGDGSAGPGNLSVNGNIVARSGDVVLIATNVQVGQQALVQAPNGATLLAAGQKVELTGPGLEGIVMQVQAPDNAAVNLGTLSGNAVGVFAGTLKHSGLVQANAVSTDGGKVVLKASGDNVVDGAIIAKSGDKGGSVDVLGDRVALYGNASIDVSGANGGGSVRVGGDLHGDNAAVQNAKVTFVGADAKINADATQSGDGGRVIVWGDDTTRFWGQISARGGANGGNGGFAETSGKQHLDFQGSADLRAPKGAAGTLLLDPNDITITTGTTTSSLGPGSPYIFEAMTGGSVVSNADIQSQLSGGNVVVKTSYDPLYDSISGSITVDAPITWGNSNSLALEAHNSVAVNQPISASTGTLVLNGFHGSVTQASAGTLTVKNLIVQSDDANLQNIGNSVGTLAASAGNLKFRNGGTLTIGNISSPVLPGPINGIDATGNVSITVSSGDLLVNAPIYVDGRVNLISSNGNINSNSSGWVEGGSVIMTASNGGISLNGGVYTEGALGSPGAVNDGSVTMTAQSINFDHINTGGYGADGANGGAVTLTATDGQISGYSIYTGGGDSSLGAGGNGGNIVLSATNYVDISSIFTYGGYGTSGGSGGSGGSLTVDSGSGGINIGYIATRGATSGVITSPEPGGDGGNVTLTATDGGWISLGDVYTDGAQGNYGGKGGNAGNITITTTSGSIGITSGSLSAQGGSAYGGGKGGKGGTVTLTANDMEVLAIRTRGGDSSGSNAGGDAGSITLNPGAYAAVYEITGQGGSAESGKGGAGATVDITSSGTAAVNLYYVDLSGGNSSTGDGGTGGSLNISTGGSLGVGSGIVTDGGSSSSLGAGGNAGDITILAGTVVSSIYASANGGSGGTDYVSPTGANGGDGGLIRIEQSSGAWSVGYVSLSATGGTGGYGTSQGAGGAGGMVSLGGKGGALTVASADLKASGGYSSDTPGTHGTVRLTGSGTGVTVTNWVNFSGNWANPGTLNLGGTAGISGGGNFVNSGKLNLSGNAYLSADGGVINNANATITAASGDVYANITHNMSSGLVNVAADGILSTDGMQNDGKLNVLGTLYAGGGCLLSTASACVANAYGLINGSTGVISGTGTIVTPILDNFGTIAPGAMGTHDAGVLNIDGDLVFEPASKYAVDILNVESYDQLNVSGLTTFGSFAPAAAVVAPASINVWFGKNTTLEVGSTFPVINGTVNYDVMPTVSAPELGIQTPAPSAPPNGLTLVVNTKVEPPPPATVPPTPAPTVAPTPEPTVAPTSPPATPEPTIAPTSPPVTSPPATSPPATSPPATSPPSPPPPPPPPPAIPLVDKITELLDGDHSTAQQVIAQLDTNPLTTFVTLVLKEEKQQAENGAPNVVANVCTK